MVVLPVFSCAGIVCALMPTVLLSTHTGGFPDVYRRDLSNDLRQIIDRWSALPMRFDAVLVGYLAGAHQVPLVEEALQRFAGKDTLVAVDPVMGDNGRRYASCTEELAEGFRRLCRQADIIFPNLTEAAMLLGVPYDAFLDACACAHTALEGLLDIGAKSIVLTGVRDGLGGIGTAVRRMGDAQSAFFIEKEYPGSYPGTGDLLASCVTAGLLRGRTLAAACRLAAGFMDRSIAAAQRMGVEPRFGVPFETALPWLSQMMQTEG